MIIPSKLYDILKLIAGIIPLISAAFGTIALALGLGEERVNVIIIVICTIGTLIKGFVEFFKSNYYKIKAEDGSVVNIDAYDEVK